MAPTMGVSKVSMSRVSGVEMFSGKPKSAPKKAAKKAPVKKGKTAAKKGSISAPASIVGVSPKGKGGIFPLVVNEPGSASRPEPVAHGHRKRCTLRPLGEQRSTLLATSHARWLLRTTVAWYMAAIRWHDSWNGPGKGTACQLLTGGNGGIGV